MIRLLDSLTHLVLAFAPIIAIAVPQDSPPATDSCTEGHFVASCAYPGLMFVDYALGMYCLNDNTDVFGYNWTWIDLDLCLTNDNGQLAASTTGAFSSSCSNCTVSSSDVYLTCDCWDTAGTSQVQASVDLNTLIYNIDGTMGCCDQMGNKTWKGPQAD